MGGFEERRQRAQEYARKLVEAEAQKKLEEQRKRDAELAVQKAEAAKHDQQQRLLAQEVLKKFNVEEALQDVKRDVWKEGKIEPTENGMGLRLVASVPFLKFFHKEYEYETMVNSERGSFSERRTGYWITGVSLQQIETNLKISYEKPSFLLDSFGYRKPPLQGWESQVKRTRYLEAIAAQNPALIIEDGEYFHTRKERWYPETLDNRNKLKEAADFLRPLLTNRTDTIVVRIDDPTAVDKLNQRLVGAVDNRIRRKSLPGEMRNAANNIIRQVPSALQRLGHLDEQALDEWDGLRFPNRYGNAPKKTGKTFFKGFFG